MRCSAGRFGGRQVRETCPFLTGQQAVVLLHLLVRGLKNMFRRLNGLLLVWLISGLLGGANAGAQPPPQSKPAAASSQVVGTDVVSAQAAGIDLATYRVGPEDLLEISVWREDTLKKEVLVR